MMAQKKSTSGSKKSKKSAVKDLAPKKAASAKVKGGGLQGVPIMKPIVGYSGRG
jgi:hypothetical protein